MRQPTRPARRALALLGSASIACGAYGFAPVSAALDGPAAPAVGEEDLFNFEHVYNLDFSDHLGAAEVAAQGTDVEFFQSTVTVRNELGVLVDAAGLPLAPGAAPYVAARDFAVVGDHTNGAFLFDITNPEDTYLASFIECANPRADTGVKQFVDADGNARTIIGISRESGYMCDESGEFVGEAGARGGVSMFDVTDPYAPVSFAGVEVDHGGAHNFMFHPTEMVAYVWNGELPGGVSTIQIIDMTTFAATNDIYDIAVLVGPQTLGSVHDGELSPDGTTMYVASENNYEIFDNTDPLAPVRLGAFTPNPGTYAHGYFPTPDGNIGITNNESLALGGFFVGGSGVCPGEGLGFYDTSIPEAVAAPLSSFVPPVAGRTDDRACTSHFGRVGPSGVAMTVGWYILGSRVVDFSDPRLPREIGAAVISRDSDLDGDGTADGKGSHAWSAKTWTGGGEAAQRYLYVGDAERGFDVFRWTGNPDCVAPWQVGWTSDCEDFGRLASDVDPAAAARAAREMPDFSTFLASPTYSCRFDQFGQ